MTRITTLVVCWLLVTPVSVFAQGPDIQSQLEKIENGQGEEVRRELPMLLKEHPDNPGVLYLQALLTTDGAEAARMYQHIVDSFPASDWADDALWKIHKFYSAIGLHRTAEIKLNQLKAQYPDSKYITGVERSPSVAEQKPEPRRQGQPDGGASNAGEKSVTPATDELPTKSYSLQVGVYSSEANANRQRQFFEYQKYPVDIVNKMKGAQQLHYVYVGSYASAEEAKAQGDEIKRTFKIEYLVITR